MFALFAFALFFVGGTGDAFAWTKNFTGTRDQVRSACSQAGGELVEGSKTTTCLGNGRGVTCDDANKCIGSGPGTHPPRINSVSGRSFGKILGIAKSASGATDADFIERSGQSGFVHGEPEVKKGPIG